LSDLFSDRMREAAVVLPDDALDHTRAAVEALATTSQSGTLLLDLVRLAFCREVRDGYGPIEEQFGRRGLQVPERFRQLAAALASLILMERFSRPVGQRRIRTLQIESLAASAVRVLADQGLPAVHPDLEPHATRWLAVVTDHLRGAGDLTPPPALPETLVPPAAVAATSADVTDEEAAPISSPDPARQLDELSAYTVRMHTWLQRSSAIGRLLFLEEQTGIGWWLQSKWPEPDPVKHVVRACVELSALTAFAPGPPAAGELLRRRLGDLQAQTIKVADLATAASRKVPAAVEDLCVILTGVADHNQPTVKADVGAASLFHELQLTNLAQIAIGTEDQ
jgi:hypothetical protein